MSLNRRGLLLARPALHCVLRLSLSSRLPRKKGTRIILLEQREAKAIWSSSKLFDHARDQWHPISLIAVTARQDKVTPASEFGSHLFPTITPTTIWTSTNVLHAWVTGQSFRLDAYGPPGVGDGRHVLEVHEV